MLSNFWWIATRYVNKVISAKLRPKQQECGGGRIMKSMFIFRRDDIQPSLWHFDLKSTGVNAGFYSGAHDSVIVSQQVQYQDPETTLK